MAVVLTCCGMLWVGDLWDSSSIDMLYGVVCRRLMG